MVFRFRWLQEKTAVEFNSRIIHKKTGKSFNSGSKIMSLNAGTGQLQVFGYGYDGEVYFSNTGAMDLKDKKMTWKMNEVTINKTKSKYTVTFSLENPNLLSVQMIDRVMDGKNRRNGSPSCVAKQKTAKSNPGVPPLGQAVSLECAGRVKRRAALCHRSQKGAWLVLTMNEFAVSGRCVQIGSRLRDIGDQMIQERGTQI